LIFVTVGAQMPFDRLIGWVDDWAVSRDRRDVCAQIGPSAYQPRRLEVLPFLDPPEFRKRMRDARGVVSHAGMGTILTALELGKPILVVPRLGSLAETRNDHQVATARRFEEDGLVLAAYDEEQFRARMERLEALPERQRIGDRAAPELLSRLRGFVLGEGDTA
jgi:UDP-N-acetylglucosamine transferase subunit ALG13